MIFPAEHTNAFDRGNSIYFCRASIHLSPSSLQFKNAFGLTMRDYRKSAETT